MAEKVIFALVLVALIILYVALRKDLQAVDPHKPPTGESIQTVITTNFGRTCDNVDAFRKLGSNDSGWIFYLVRCHDGGRYVYSWQPNEGQLDVLSCTEAKAKGYTCPK